MPAIELLQQDEKGLRTAGVWYCSKCRCVYGDQQAAQGCHGVKLCACGQPTSSKYSKQCQSCSDREWHERVDREESQRYEKAAKVNAADWQGEQVFWGDRYFETVEEAVEFAQDDDMPAPEYIWAAKNVGVPKARREDLIDRILEGMWEDADEYDLEGILKLQAAIDEFNLANSGVAVWMVDYSTAILINDEPAQSRPTPGVEWNSLAGLLYRLGLTGAGNLAAALTLWIRRRRE